MSTDVQQSLNVLVDGLAAVLGEMAGAEATASTGSFVLQQCWVATLIPPGERAGTGIIAIDAAGAAALGRLVSQSPDDLEDASVGDLLRRAIERAAAALAADPAGHGLELTLATLEPREDGPAAGLGTDHLITIPGVEAALSVRVVWSEPAAAAASDASRTPAGERLGDRIDVILDIDLPVVVRFGRTQMPIRTLSKIGPGSVIDLGRSPDDPVEILVSDRVVARGEVVIVGGNYGVRVLDVTSQSERARSLES